jgi:hypothetical protein
MDFERGSKLFDANSKLVKMASRGFLVRFCLVTLGMSIVVLSVAAATWLAFGRDGLLASLIAGLFCWLVGSLSLAACELFQHESLLLVRILVGMLIRMAGLLSVCAVVAQRSEWLLECGFLGNLVLFYMAGLAFEILLSVGGRQSMVGSQELAVKRMA